MKVIKLDFQKDFSTIKSFLNENYLETFIYPDKILQWCLKDSIILAYFDDHPYQIKGIITGKDIKTIVNGVKQQVFQVNFLSVHKEYRQKGITRVLREALPTYTRSKIAFYTTNYPLKYPAFCITTVKHLNLKQMRVNKTNGNQKEINLRRMTLEDVPSVLNLLQKDSEKYNVTLSFTREIVIDLLKNIDTFVSTTEKGGGVTGFISFYKTLKKNGNVICNIYYYTDLFLLKELVIQQKIETDMDEIRCISVGPNTDYYLTELGFTQGTGIMYYHMYHKSDELPIKVNLLMV